MPSLRSGGLVCACSPVVANAAAAQATSRKNSRREREEKSWTAVFIWRRIVLLLASRKTQTKKAAESGLCPGPDQQLTCVRGIDIGMERPSCQTGILEKNL